MEKQDPTHVNRPNTFLESPGAPESCKRSLELADGSCVGLRCLGSIHSGEAMYAFGSEIKACRKQVTTALPSAEAEQVGTTEGPKADSLRVF